MTTRAQFIDIFPTEFEQILSLNRSEFSFTSVLVTGSNGMLGNAVAITLDKLIHKHAHECDLYLASRSWPAEATGGFEGSPILITNNEVRNQKYNFDLIVHCASPSNVTKIESYEHLIEINRGFLENCISSATKKVIFISSGEVYKGGSTKIEAKKTDRVTSDIRDWYPLAKIDCEEYLFKMNSTLRLSVDIIRLFHTFGPGLSRNDGRSFSDILYAAADDEVIKLKSDGSQIRSFLYLGDAVSAILQCVRDDSEFRLLNVGSPNQISILQFAELVANSTDSDVIIEKKGFSHSPFNFIVPDISETLAWGWTPKVEIQDSINLTLDWIKRQKL